MAAHSSILAWRNPWTEEPERATVRGLTKSWTRLQRVSTQACPYLKISRLWGDRAWTTSFLAENGTKGSDAEKRLPRLTCLFHPRHPRPGSCGPPAICLSLQLCSLRKSVYSSPV